MLKCKKREKGSAFKFHCVQMLKCTNTMLASILNHCSSVREKGSACYMLQFHCSNAQIQCLNTKYSNAKVYTNCTIPNKTKRENGSACYMYFTVPLRGSTPPQTKGWCSGQHSRTCANEQRNKKHTHTHTQNAFVHL